MKKLTAQAKTLLEQIENGNIKTNNVKVLEFVKENKECTINYMRVMMDIPHQTLTSRITHLLDCGLIKCVGDVEIEDRHYSKYVYVHNGSERSELRTERFGDKYLAWLNRGMREFKGVAGSHLMQQLMVEQNNIENHRR